MKRLIIFFVIATAALTSAQDFNKNGTAGFVFLELPVNARTAALGECSIGLADMNSSAVFTNPGALGFTKQTLSFSATYAPWIADIKDYAASFAYNTPFGVFAVSAIALDYGSMPRTVKLTGQRIYEQVGTFSANSEALGLTYAKQLTDRYSFGVTVKYVNEKIDVYNASNLLFDGGFLYYTGFSSLRLGASIQNFGVNAKFINGEFKMPAIVKLGLAAEAYQTDMCRATVMAEALHPTDAPEKLNLGLEVALMNALTVRGGYKFFSDEESYSLGVGVNYTYDIPVSFDFSFADYGRLGNLVRFTLQMGLL